jgi:hypothetical protein
LGAIPAVAVLYTNRLVAGDVTGVAAFVAVKAIRGINNPEFVDAMSSIAEEAGSAPVAFIPILCASVVWITTMHNMRTSNDFFMVMGFDLCLKTYFEMGLAKSKMHRVFVVSIREKLIFI